MSSFRYLRTALIGGAIGLAALAAAALRLEVDAKPGEVISGERIFRVTVQSDRLVTQVEFYVGDDLRATDESLPYEFRLDTLAEPEGPVRVRFVAYDDQGRKAEQALELTIDNGLDKGAEHFVERARELLTERKWDEAILAGRVALKARPGYNPARLVLARANFGKGVYDTAQKFCRDILDEEPDNAEALQLLAAVQVRTAFTTVVRRGISTEEALSAIRSALTGSAEAAVRVLLRRLDDFGEVTDANRLAFADLAIRAHRYSRAIEMLQGEFRRDPRRPEIANRLIYAQLRTNRLSELTQTIANYERFGGIDAYGHALRALFYSRIGDEQKAQEAEREALLADSQDLGVRTAQAFLALQRGNAATLREIATGLARDEGGRPEVSFYLSALYWALGRADESRAQLEQTVLTDPVNYDMYVEAANQELSLALRRAQDGATEPAADHRKMARVYFETALAVRPDSFEALTGLALVDLLEDKNADAVRRSEAAVRAGRDYPAALYAHAAALSRVNRVAEANRALEQAGRLDPAQLAGRGIPGPAEAWVYFQRWGRIPLIAPPR